MQVSSASSAPGQAADTRALAGHLLELWQRIARDGGAISAAVDDLGLTLGQLKLLELLCATSSEPSVKQLSGAAGCSLPHTSRTVEALVQRGLASRREDEHDRRIKRVTVTEAGRDAVARINGLRLQALERFAGDLDPEQRDRLTTALAELPPNVLTTLRPTP